MANFNVMVNLTRTIEYSVEIEVTAKDEDAAEEKVTAKVGKILEGGVKDIIKEMDFEEQNSNDEFEYEVSEG